jgi:signal transduction histidine kinase
MNARVIVQDSGDSENLSKLLDEAITESVRISENLVPAKLRDFDLSICLRSLCLNLEKSTHTNISFEAHGKRIDMPQTQKVNFYRIAQEAVNNSIKHAAAKTITIQLNEEPHTVRLSIEDDGAGMVQESTFVTGRNGLVNMRDRAEIMGGKFTMESDPKRGTMIIVEVPTEMLTK